MAKKKVTTKLDATVKTTRGGSKFEHTVPERKKPIGALQKAFVVGSMATIWLRNFDEIKSTFYLKEIECVLVAKSTNCFYYEDEDERKKAAPWWAVYDFNVEEDGSGDTDEGGGEDQLQEQPGSGDTGGPAVGDLHPDGDGEEPGSI